ncbi:Hydroxyproline-rich glycoprotein family protein [Abeliophyllum distichum]|uniref:Hydroxyproline-rich glycoprotein family protein n=1 Tax=Abeliophyllum distichum TaxID=126358 RepID=A0ABD1UGL4_9LAMI
MESHLEKLTDETQVLARFEDFPTKKLEALRIGAAMYSRLDSVANTLQNWQIVSPVGQLQDKVENYFNKVSSSILVRIKELMVDVSSSCMELALKEIRDLKAKEKEEFNTQGRKKGYAKMLWKAFQFAFRVYTFAGGQDDRADKLTRELAHEIETNPYQ